MQRKIKIFVCSSQPLLLAGLKLLINKTASLQLMGETKTSSHLSVLLKKKRVDVLIIDIDGCTPINQNYLCEII